MKKMRKTGKKLYRFEVDQSVRIEELSRDSIVALANSEQFFTVTVTRGVKRRLQEMFRRSGQPKQFAIKTFNAAIILAVKKSRFLVQELVIDIEYTGYERDSIKFITDRLPNISVYFTSIGKKSPAHFAAYGVFQGRKKADYRVSLREVIQTLKNGSRTVTPLDKARRFAAHAEPSKRKYKKKV